MLLTAPLRVPDQAGPHAVRLGDNVCLSLLSVSDLRKLWMAVSSFGLPTSGFAVRFQALARPSRSLDRHVH